jgi:hypothetical protein
MDFKEFSPTFPQHNKHVAEAFCGADDARAVRGWSRADI